MTRPSIPGRHRTNRRRDARSGDEPPDVRREIEAHAERTPDALAVAHGAARLSYGQLDRRANRLAQDLRRLGAGPERVIALLLPRCPELVIGALAAWKAGAAYLPLDPAHPPERLAFLVEDAGAAAVVTFAHLGAKLAAPRPPLVALDADRRDPTSESAERPAVEVAPGTLAYLIYTSGSSGQPKGVAVEHASLANLVRWHREAYGLTPADRCTWLASPAFDASVWEVWSCLAAGSSLFIPEPELLLSPPKLLAWLRRERIALTFLPTPLAEAVLLEPCPPELPLRALLTGGDALHRRPSPAAPYRLFNHYGPTEGTVVATSTPVDSAGDGGLPPIGRPISGTEVHLLGPDLEPVPAGRAGELCLGGVGLARGYLNRPGLTAERFVPDALSGRPGARLYLTGDLARRRPDGNLEFLGRIDHQVKIRGVRIELGEIEAALKAHPALRDACVLAWGEGPDRKLVAYVVARRQPGPAPGEIAAHLGRSLPEVMVPALFVALRELPLTPNGKMDRRALPPPDAAALRTPIGAVPPRTHTEEVLVAIWSAVLGVPCGVHDSFLDLGGHSLSAMQILARVRDAYGADLPVHSLFAAPTVADLAEVIEAARWSEAPPPLAPRPEGVDGAPLSFAQQRLWVLDRLEPGNPFYNEPLAVRVTGALRRPALAKALSEICHRHQVLRISLPEEDGGPVQRLAAAALEPGALPLLDLAALPPAARDGEARRLRREGALRPFDLASGPLFRTLLVRLAEGEHWLLATFHHAVFDGWSVGVLLRELAALYPAAAAGAPAAPPPLPLQYGDYAAWQRAWLTGGELARQLDYWRRQLADLPTLELPTDRPRPLRPTYRAAASRFAVPPQVGERLAVLGRGEGATPFMTLLAAWSALLGRLAGEDDVAVGSAVAGRVRTELESLIGCFANTLVMRVDLGPDAFAPGSQEGGDPTFRQLLARVRRATLDAFAHQDLPFERLVEELRPQRELGRNPLFQVALVLQPNPPGSAMPCGDLVLQTMEEPAERVRFDLELHAWEDGAGLGGRLLVSTDLFAPATGEEMVHALEELLERAARDPDQSVGELLDAGDARRLPPARCDSVGGERVDLEAVESALRDDPAVRDCAALVRQDGEGARSLVAYVVGAAPLAPESLAARLASRLPAAAVPAAFIPVSSIPLTRSGRPDRRSLAALAAIDSDLLRRWDEALRRVRGVAQVAVVVREVRAPSPPLHLADLLPGWRRGGGSGAPRSALAATALRPEPCGEAALALSHGGPVHLPGDFPPTLAAALRRAAERSPEKGILYLDAAGAERRLSYPELLAAAERLLGGLRRAAARPGDKVLLQLPDNLQFLTGLWACQLGGLVPVPVPIPPAYTADNAVVQKLHNAWALLGEPLVLADRSLAPAIHAAASGLAGLRVAAIEDLAAGERDGAWHEADPDDLALLLLTSGSTGKPKAVMHSHRTLLTRSAAEVQWNEFRRDDVSLNWLPLDHVASLVQFHLRDVYLGCDEVQAATEPVLRNPLHWLDLIDRFRATVTWAPNFAFGLVNDCAAEIERRRWDLGSMRNLLDGGEAIVAKTARRFLELLAPHGLPPGALHPVWGMSETAAGVTSSKRFSLATTRPEDSLVEVGEPLPGVSFRIVDAADRPVEEGTIGRLQVRGPTVTLGYCNAPEQTRESFAGDGWFKTGDLALLRDGRLTITGREKNVIIIHGVNYYSHEIEAVVEEVKGVQVTYTAALAVRRPESDTDELAIFFSPDVAAAARLGELLGEVRERVARQVGVASSYLLPVPPQEIPKTGIGKIQHPQLRQRFERGEFAALIKRVDLLTANANTLPSWFFEKVWRRRETPAPTVSLAGGWLVFLDGLGLGEALVAALRAAGASCVAVAASAAFARRGPDSFALDPAAPQDYRRLADTLAEEGFAVDGVLHLWTYDGPAAARAAASAMEQRRGVYSLLLLAQALAAGARAERPVRLLVVSSHAQAVVAGDDLTCERAACLGLLKTLGQELPWLSCRHLDLPGERPDLDVRRVLGEAQSPHDEPEVAYRAGRRLVARLETIAFTPASARQPPLRPGGRYLITGGLGGVGATLAAYLLREHAARLLVVGRSPLPDRSAASGVGAEDGPAEQRLRALLDLERLGGEVIYEAADVCDPAALRQALAGAEARWGAPLDGVFHLAAVAHERWLADETPEGLAATLAPKVAGTWALHQHVADRPGTLFVTFSSVNGFFGGVSVGSYAAANSFLDAFSHFQRRTSGLASRCIAWSLWQDLGMSRGSATTELARARGYQPISAERGIRSLLVALAHDRPAILVGLDDGKREISRHLETRDCGLADLCAYYTAAEPVAEEDLAGLAVRDRFGIPPTCAVVRLDTLPLTADGAIDRAALAGLATRGERERRERTLPRSELERELAAIWAQVIGVPEVGLEDSFFELGGHSLLATQMLSRVRQRLGVELAMHDLFSAPTLGALAAVTAARRRAGAEREMESLLAEIEQLSADEIQNALAQSDSAAGEVR
jgi:amino acid adenylation domain-containing protein